MIPNHNALLERLLVTNPQVVNNPQAQVYLDAIRSGDTNRMKMLATNICASYGVTPEQARNDTMRFFGFGR